MNKIKYKKYKIKYRKLNNILNYEYGGAFKAQTLLSIPSSIERSSSNSSTSSITSSIYNSNINQNIFNYKKHVLFEKKVNEKMVYLPLFNKVFCYIKYLVDKKNTINSETIINIELVLQHLIEVCDKIGHVNLTQIFNDLSDYIGNLIDKDIDKIMNCLFDLNFLMIGQYPTTKNIFNSLLTRWKFKMSAFKISI